MRRWTFQALTIGLLAALGAAVSAAPSPAAPAPATPAVAPDVKTAEPAAGPRTCEGPPEPVIVRGSDVMRQALSYYTRGRLHMMAGENLLAAQQFRRAAALAPDVGRIWLFLGVTAADSGDLAGAAESLDKALALAAANPAALYLRARVAEKQDDSKQAADLYKRLLAAAPHNSAQRILGTYYLAKIDQRNKDIEGATALFESLLELIKEPQGYFQRYNEVMALFAQQAKIKEELGRMYLIRGASDKAIGLFKELLDAHPADRGLMELMTAAHLQKKDFDGARTWARKMIDAFPEDVQGYQRLAEIFTAEGKPQNILPELEKLHREHPDNRAAAFQLAELYRAAGRTDDAAALYRGLLAAMEKAPRGASAVAAGLRLADIELLADRPVEALAALGAVMGADLTENPAGARVEQLVATLKDPVAVLQNAQRLVGDDVKGFGPFVAVALLAEQAKSLDAAVALYDKAIAREPKAAVAYARKAEILIRTNHLEDALAVFQAALRAGVDTADFRRRMGMIMERLGRPVDALAQYRLARKADPNNLAVRYLILGVLARTGQVKEAETELKTLLAGDPENAAVRYLLATAYAMEGDGPAAEKELQQVLARKPDHAPSKSDLATLWAQRGANIAEAEKLAREALKADPKSPAYLGSLGWVLYKEGNIADAAKLLQEAVAGAPDLNGQWWDFLGDAYWRLGNSAEAVKAWEAAIRILKTQGPVGVAAGLNHVETKVKSVQAGQTPTVAPLAAKD
jgi:tetratricopeptide (TPR) repeat protein